MSKKQVVARDINLDEFRQHKTDTGSSEVQIASLTERIDHLVEHLKINKKDHHSRRGLLILVGRRRRLISYLQKNSPEAFEKVTKKLKLKVAAA